jgi:hypothetical protein
MSIKKNNFLPLLLIGGGAAAAALLYGVGSKQNKEDLSVVDGLGTVGSGDFLASSGVSKGYDSVDLGIEDFANNRANADAFALPSDGANPERVLDDSGEWTFADTLAVGLAGVGAAPAVAKGAKYAATKVGSAGAGQAVKSAGSTVARSASGSALKTAATTVLKKMGPVGAVATGIDALVGTANAAEAQFNEQEIFNISQNISTDLAAKVGIGNMVTDRQLAHAKGLSAGAYPVTMASKEEAALVNKAVGLSPTSDVLKVSGSKFTSYVPERGMQVVHGNTGTLKQAVDVINKSKKRA